MQCTMGVSTALRFSKITKSKSPDFAQFRSKPTEAVWDRWKLPLQWPPVWNLDLYQKLKGKRFMYKSTANIAIAKRMVCLIGIYLGRYPEKKNSWSLGHYPNCVTRAPLLYFIRSWVALSFKVVSQWVSESVSEASVTPVQISTLCNI